MSFEKYIGESKSFLILPSISFHITFARTRTLKMYTTMKHKKEKRRLSASAKAMQPQQPRVAQNAVCQKPSVGAVNVLRHKRGVQ